MSLDSSFYNNPLSDWLLALTGSVLFFLALKGLVSIVRRRVRRLEDGTAAALNGIVPELLGKIHPVSLLFFSVFFGTQWLELPEIARGILRKAAFLVLLLQCALVGSTGIRYWTRHYRKKKLEVDANAATTLSSVGFLLRLLLWVIFLLIALDYLGIDITALVASLGIGGIAVALAVQNILGDLFASFSIVLDKPFVIGDFIIVDSFMGTVEHIGLKTTRVRSLSGELLIFSNTDLLKSRIRNFKQMQERRVVFSIGVTYQTLFEKIQAIPAILEAVVKARERVRFDRAHFKGYGPFSLDFEVVYWIDSPDYALYMDIQQTINLEIFRRFEGEGIEFAYPTQTLHFKSHPEKSPGSRPFQAEHGRNTGGR